MAAVSIANITSMARSFLKVDSNYGSTEEVRISNYIESLVSSYYRWHWNITAGTGIAVSAGTQTYTMNAADQNRVLAIAQANLLEGSTEQPPLMVWSDPPVPLYTTQGQPIAVSLISPTQVRLYPNADATYTFQWRYYDRPAIHTANTEVYDVPEAFTDVVKSGFIWQLMEFADDERASIWEKRFYLQLDNLKRIEQTTMSRNQF